MRPKKDWRAEIERDLITSQPAPTPTAGPALWDLVIEDMKARDDFGRNKYGMRLQADNGRDVLKDIADELLDAVVYLRQLRYERDGK